MKKVLILMLCICFYNCKKDVKVQPQQNREEKVSGDTTGLKEISTKDFTDFKVTDSEFIDSNAIWRPFHKALSTFRISRYDSLKPLILEKDIPSIQESVADGDLTYEELVLFYLYRIREFDRMNEKSLNSVITLNPDALKTAKILDGSETRVDKHSVFGMPIMLKDNINTEGMPTTAGAVALLENSTGDAFVTERLKEKGAIILGKTNLSEWAYFFCGDCPSGYSAVGGQTFNPYGRKILDTGGSSSGSAVAVTANFCVAAVGTETSGSILSPSSQNSVVGLKPTVGLLSRSGIIPISSTLDTPGPMTKSVVDNAIILQSMVGMDPKDRASADGPEVKEFYVDQLSNASIQGKRFGAIKELKKDTLYVQALKVLESQGATIIEIDPLKIELPNFLRLLNLDMKKDLPAYFSIYGNKELGLATVEDVVSFNMKDSFKTAPYGQKLFKGIMEDEATSKEFKAIKDTLFARGQSFFEKSMSDHNLDAVLSINNYHAGYAAVARYPAITIPMGYTDEGEPKGITFITSPFREEKLLQWGFVYERASKRRIFPNGYK